MSMLAPTLEAFFTQRMMAQKNASPHTIASYRDCFRLLLGFAHEQTGKAPSDLGIDDLDAPMIAAFLDHLEHERGIITSSRNTRLAAIRSLFHFAAYRHPEHAALIQRVLAIQSKRGERALVCFLTVPEVDALLASPDPTTRIGRRDHALLVVAVQTGLRVSELTGLCRRDLQLGTGAHVRCEGKGRKERAPHTTHPRQRRRPKRVPRRTRRWAGRRRLPRATRRCARARRSPPPRRKTRRNRGHGVPFPGN